METTRYSENQRVMECFPQHRKSYLSCKYEEDHVSSVPITLLRVFCSGPLNHSFKKAVQLNSLGGA